MTRTSRLAPSLQDCTFRRISALRAATVHDVPTYRDTPQNFAEFGKNFLHLLLMPTATTYNVSHCLTVAF